MIWGNNTVCYSEWSICSINWLVNRFTLDFFFPCSSAYMYTGHCLQRCCWYIYYIHNFTILFSHYCGFCASDYDSLFCSWGCKPVLSVSDSQFSCSLAGLLQPVLQRLSCPIFFQPHLWVVQRTFLLRANIYFRRMAKNIYLAWWLQGGVSGSLSYDYSS